MRWTNQLGTHFPRITSRPDADIDLAEYLNKVRDILLEIDDALRDPRAMKTCDGILGILKDLRLPEFEGGIAEFMKKGLSPSLPQEG
jgi:hypothetical protein